MCMTCTLLQIQWFSYSPLATVSCEGSSVPLDKMQVGFQRRKPSTSMLYLQCHGKVRWEHSHVHQSLTSNKNLQQDSLDSVSIRFLRAQNFSCAQKDRPTWTMLWQCRLQEVVEETLFKCRDSILSYKNSLPAIPVTQQSRDFPQRKGYFHSELWLATLHSR